jgi:carbon storage regulator
MIGPDIKITIVKVERNQVRIGIDAPRGVSILRDELIEPSRHDPNNRSDEQSSLAEITS